MKIQIDNEKFAYTVVKSTTLSDENLTDEEIAKKKLQLYLISYFLIEKFNTQEKKDFRDSKEVQDMLAQIKFTM